MEVLRMYRTYELKGNEKYFIFSWSGDTGYYSVFETLEEMEKEKKRLKKIEKEYEEAMKRYLTSNCGI
jgi:hypothetical protein